MPQAIRWGLMILACTLLAGGSYYAWQTCFSQNNPAESVITAITATGIPQRSALAQTDAVRPQIHLTRVLASVGLFKALGGGWKMIDPSLEAQ